MPKVSEIGVRYRGGFKGPYIGITQLIDNGVKLDILDFIRGASCVKSCESYCRMQIRIGGRLYVTWHSSEVLANYLSDCRQKEAEEGVALFPIEECIITVGEDRAYYLMDAPDNCTFPAEKDLERMVAKAKRNRR